MKLDVTRFDGLQPTAESSGSGFGRLDSDLRRQAYRNLSQVGMVYAAVYFVAYFFYWYVNILREPEQGFHFPETRFTLTAGLSIAFSLWVAAGARKGLFSPNQFLRKAQVFLVLTCLGIAANEWGWEEHLNHAQHAYGGVSWVGVWIVMFPLIVTLPPKRTLIASLAGAITLPATLYASALVNGAGESPSASIALTNPIAFQVAVPVIICVAIATYSSHRVFRMASDVSEARRMGAYRLTEKIGAGGMGEVWRAEHQLLARPAAIKLVHPAALGGEDSGAARTLLARFEREANATAMLSSPHTVQIYDFGVSDGSFYYVMELLEGMDLKTLVETSGPVPAERAVRFLRQACHSLADAHAAGMIHRDIKPANLFTCRRGLELDFVKVLDFGLVKETDTGDDDRTQLTMQGVASGTPAFMAPEMAEGDPHLDGRADLYALGCVGYWLLTGELVFQAGSAVAMLVQHAREAAAPPSARSELPIPATLDKLILTCLEKRPDARPSSAAELDARLREIEQEIGEWTQARAARWWSAHLPQLIRTAAPSPTGAPSTVPS
ncbi:MAG TPA: serine/threonine-protein kinase [bacterium]|nr:serine/threonine-protein kinase [bacterium]